MGFSTILLTAASDEVCEARGVWHSMGPDHGHRRHGIYDHDHFPDFCRYLVGERSYSATDLCGVIDKPYAWSVEYRQYLIWRACDHAGHHLATTTINVACPRCSHPHNDLDDTLCLECRADLMSELVG